MGMIRGIPPIMHQILKPRTAPAYFCWWIRIAGSPHSNLNGKGEASGDPVIIRPLPALACPVRELAALDCKATLAARRRGQAG